MYIYNKESKLKSTFQNDLRENGQLKMLRKNNKRKNRFHQQQKKSEKEGKNTFKTT